MKKYAGFLAAAACALLCSCGTAAERNTLIPEPRGAEDYSVTRPNIDDLLTEKTETEQAPASESLEESEAEQPLEGESTAHLLCVGDNLIHDNIYNEALKAGGGTEYDFSGMYDLIEPYVQRADVAIVNQETLVNDAFEPQSYPVFSTPTAAGDELVRLGFNVVSMSNNHVLDMGAEGLISSLNYWDSKGVVHYGAYRDEADSEDIRLMEVNGITFAFLGYMEHTNGVSLYGDEGKVVYLSEEETVERQIRQADELADVVVVSCHFGTEVQHELNAQQTELTPKLVEWGADLIIGTQAHCVSTCGYLDKPDGGQAFVYYGLGNFFHTMYDRHSAAGIMGDLDVVKDNATGEVSFENVKAIPVISHYEGYDYNSAWFNCRVYPYAQYTDELFSLNFNDSVTRESVDECLSCIPEEFLAIE